MISTSLNFILYSCKNYPRLIEFMIFLLEQYPNKWDIPNTNAITEISGNPIFVIKRNGRNTMMKISIPHWSVEEILLPNFLYKVRKMRFFSYLIRLEFDNVIRTSRK